MNCRTCGKPAIGQVDMPCGVQYYCGECMPELTELKPGETKEKTKECIIFLKRFDVVKGACYFSTFIDEKTITCSPDGSFDDYGSPITICNKLDSCEKIKDLNKRYKH